MGLNLWATIVGVAIGYVANRTIVEMMNTIVDILTTAIR